MESVVIPKQISIKNIINEKSFSPRNYKTILIKREKQVAIAEFLISDRPYDKGGEPGRNAYVNNSTIWFLRNSCIDRENFSYQPNKLINLNPKYGITNILKSMDVLLCKDANIGDSCLYIDEDGRNTLTSSGIVRLNFKEDHYKYYCLAFLKDEYFLRQLDYLTPKGATIRHSGERFLLCRIPSLRGNEDWVYSILGSLVLNLSHSERICRSKLAATEEFIAKELLVNKVQFKYPDIRTIVIEKRCDAGIYSPKVYELFENISLYSGGSNTLSEYGFSLKRGPNLAKRDLGRSIQLGTYHANYHLLVYPSDISEGGYLLRTSYLGARNPIWYLKSGDILFSAEGTVGKTFVICDEKYMFTTNFHGMIIHPTSDNIDIKKSVFLGLFLNFLKARGILSLLAVGGQGGSFAEGYWDYLKIPLFPEQKTQILSDIYNNEINLNPKVFQIDGLKSAGIYQLNNFRIMCKSMLQLIVDDLKEDNLQSLSYYEERIRS
jgi:hypothetical protein